ncbi:cold shock domain-containing protein [Amylibacter sp. IMCC11727]|uniref:cold-shock protein n=1 Tax=Amylibacter sp. IMCC11727 TaxID=3039851 RepID=UPI00244DD1A9|nr:cold shock domain-containing protein [Amylibacter sp. IMCC11727]WGI20362.1 cold shock domain-containing protein [Amylibacter sp. IMCC11727]
MGQAIKKGHVLWYDPSRGYGFIRDNTDQTIFITQGSLDAIGMEELPEGAEIEFNVIKGRASDKVNSIVHVDQMGPIQ